jgi:hypothetical protein
VPPTLVSPIGSAIRVTNVIRRMRGGAQSNLVSCDDGKHYVMKMRPNPQGPNILANEALGALLLEGLGLPCPRVAATSVSSTVILKFPMLAFESDQGPRMPQKGLHFASQFMDVAGSQLFDCLPESYETRIENQADFLGIYIFDIWASHQDRRQCIYRQDLRTGKIWAVFIDNGHLFGGPDWSKVGNHDCARSVITEDFQGLDEARISSWISHFRKTVPSLLHGSLGFLPVSWYEGDIDALATRLLERLKILPDLIESHSLGIVTVEGIATRETSASQIRTLDNKMLFERFRLQNRDINRLKDFRRATI